MKKVTVIVPVYNIASFVGRCAESLMKQTLQDAEYIFVDDCSTDNSVDIIKQTIETYNKKNDCIIIHHDHNKGLPAARNSGLEIATGEYILHCDGDDWLEQNALELMYNTAVRSNADMVWCDFYITFDKNERLMKAEEYTNTDDLIRKGFLSGALKFNVWNKLVRRSIYDQRSIRFPEGHSMGEDMTMIMVAGLTNRVAYLPNALYHYVKTNPNAHTQTITDKNLSDIRYNVDRVTEWLENEFPGRFTEELNFFKLSIKLPFLMTGEKAMFNLWREWYPEANDYIFLNHQMPVRIRVVQWMGKQNMWLGVKLYHTLIYRVIYGLIYK